MVPLVAMTSAAGMTWLTTTEVSNWHNLYPAASAAGLAWPDSSDLPHMPERNMTYYTSSVEAGTARTFFFVGPVPSETWYGFKNYGPYGPNIFGD